MLTCKFESGSDALLRHDVAHVLAIKDNKILLVKRAKGIIEGGKWGFPGGFLDRDENLEQCALRELMEETGYEGKVKELFRINSNPHRKNDSARQNVAHEFLVEVREKIGKPDWEQTEVKWFDFLEIDLENMAFDHSKTIKLLQDYLNGTITLPIIE